MFFVLAHADGQTFIETATLIGDMLGQGMLPLVGLVLVGLLVVGLWRIMDAANAAAPAHRTMEPGMIWLLLVPFFQVYWNFRALPAVSDSLAATMREKGLKPDDCGRSIGMIWSLLVLGIYILHIISWTTEGFLISIGASGLVQIEMTLMGMFVVLAWLAVCACIVIYIVKVQAAKSQILATGDTSSPPT